MTNDRKHPIPPPPRLLPGRTPKAIYRHLTATRQHISTLVHISRSLELENLYLPLFHNLSKLSKRFLSQRFLILYIRTTD